MGNGLSQHQQTLGHGVTKVMAPNIFMTTTHFGRGCPTQKGGGPWMAGPDLEG